jgi:hypothetical protein
MRSIFLGDRGASGEEGDVDAAKAFGLEFLDGSRSPAEGYVLPC